MSWCILLVFLISNKLLNWIFVLFYSMSNRVPNWHSNWQMSIRCAEDEENKEEEKKEKEKKEDSEPKVEVVMPF